MQLKIFYSWQSQTKERFNRFFIKDCLEKAIKSLKEIPETSQIEYQLIDSTMEEPGTPAVADTILKKIIPSMDIFIGDVTVVNKLSLFRKLFASKGHRSFVNQNVLIEFSTAMNELGNERIIHVMNKFYGDPTGLTFDINHLKYPVSYSAHSNKTLKDAKEPLIDSLTRKIKQCSEFCFQYYRNRFSPFKTWSTWENNIYLNAYVSNEKIVELSEVIYKAADESGTILRLVGLSGLGKTRILFELFRPIEGNLESKMRSGRLLYYDTNYAIDGALVKVIEEIIEAKNEYILILDNCQPDLCRSLIPKIQNAESKVSLISIDNNPEELYEKIQNVTYLSLDKKDLSDVVEHILRTDFSEMSEIQIKKIQEFSQGIPLMAVLLGVSIRNGEEFVGRLEDKDLLDKLLGSFAKDREVRTLLQSSALFMNFGHEEELELQFDFIATNKDLTVTNNSDAVSKKLFREVINHYVARQIFEKKGRTIGMRPFPLSIYLTKEWLDAVSPQTVINLLNAIAGLAQPHQKNLSEAIAEQMRHLGYDNNAKTIVERITGDASPFGNAEVLNTELGSRLFRAFVEVNPEAIANTFDRIFADLNDDQIKSMVKGRRNLVGVLEKLCFNYSTFHQGARLLYRFAIAENETWTNNATGQFLHLFNIVLAGTEAKPVDKIEIINWGLKQDIAYQILAIKAMSSALNFGSFVRMSGAEVQGSRTLEDYRPYKNEVYDYWRFVLEEFLQILYTREDLSELAFELLIPKLRNLVRAEFSELLKGYIKPLLKIARNNTDPIIRQLHLILRYDANYLDEGLKILIKELIHEYTKNDFDSRYQRIIKNYQFDYFEDHSQEKINEEIDGLAELFIESNLDWNLVVPSFYENVQYGIHLFGKSLAKKLIKNDSLTKFIELTSEILFNKPRNEVNLTLLGGIFLEVDKDIAEQFEQYFVNKQGLEYVLFYLRSLRQNRFELTDDLFELIDHNLADIKEFDNFAINGRYNTDIDNIEEFINRLGGYGRDGYLIAFKILFNLSFWEGASLDKLLPLLRTCIIKLGTINNERDVDDYQWWETIKRILTIQEDNEFASLINSSIIESIDWKNSYHLDHSVQEIYVILLKKYFDVIWPELSDNLVAIGDNYIKYFGLKHILGSSIGGIGRSVGVLFDGDLDKIFEWANNHQPIAPQRLADLVPVFSTKIRDENVSWHPAATRLIDQFGADTDVLNNLNSNLGSFSWTGSVVPYYEAQLKLMELIQNHNITEVSKWAKERIENLKKQIATEKNRDAEWDIR